MKAKRVSTKWIGDMGFESDIDGHKIVIDAKEAVGGHNQGPTPKPLMITALSGCTAMDVVSILKKMKVDFDMFQIHVDSELTDEHPKHYSKMHLIYEFSGNNLPVEKLEKAINLSLTKYCGVNHLYKQVIEIDYEIVINEK